MYNIPLYWANYYNTILYLTYITTYYIMSKHDNILQR